MFRKQQAVRRSGKQSHLSSQYFFENPRKGDTQRYIANSSNSFSRLPISHDTHSKNLHSREINNNGNFKEDRQRKYIQQLDHTLREDHKKRSSFSLFDRKQRNFGALSPTIHEEPSEEYTSSMLLSHRDARLLNPKQKSIKVQIERGSRSKTQIEAEVDFLKQSTIYKKKNDSSPYTLQQAYFGLYSAKSKYQKLKQSKKDGKSVIIDPVKSERKNGGQDQQMRYKDEYQRLRKYLIDLQQEVKKLRQDNHSLRLQNKKAGNSPKSQIKVEESPSNNNKLIKKNKFENESKGEGGEKIITVNEIQGSQSVTDLLKQAHQEIAQRDNIITDLELKLHQISKAITKPNSSPPKSPIDISLGDEVPRDMGSISKNLTNLKNYIDFTNSELNLLKAKQTFLQRQITEIKSRVTQYSLYINRMNLKIMEKEVEIQMHMKYTRDVMRKLGFWVEQADQNVNMNIQNIWYLRQNELISSKSSLQSFYWPNNKIPVKIDPPRRNSNYVSIDSPFAPQFLHNQVEMRKQNNEKYDKALITHQI